MLELTSYPIHHIALAVHDIESSTERYREDFGYHELPRETVEAFQSEVAFLIPTQNSDHQQTAIELISPISEKSPLTKFLEKKGEGMHHICFSVPDINQEHSRLMQLGYRFTTDTPRDGAHHAKVLFIHPKSIGGVLIELRQDSGS